MSSSATGVGMTICFLGAILLILTQKSSQKFGDVLGIFLVLMLSKYESNIATFNYLKPLTWVAQNGVIILATHCYLIFIYNTISNTLNINNIVINFILKFSFVFIILFTLIIPFCNRYLYWILGNKPKRWFDNYKQ